MLMKAQSGDFGRNKDGEVRIWMMSVCLLHRKEYHEIYKAFVKSKDFRSIEPKKKDTS